MADHSEFVALAREMIQEEGRQITLAQLDETPVDTDRPWNGPTAPTTKNPVSCYAVFVPVSSLTSLGIYVADNDLFKTAEEVCIVEPPANDEDLTTYHVYCDGASITAAALRRIKIVQMLKPGPTPVLYAIGASR